MIEKVLVTGGHGYLGGRIARALARHPEYTVFITTRTGDCPPCPWISPSRCLKMDLLEDSEVREACEGMDSIIHLAAMDEHESAADPLKALLVNGAGAMRLVDAAAAAGSERVIYFSTAHVYRSPLTGTITEETLPRPTHPYAITHRVAEDYVLAAREKGLLEGLVVRLSNGIGAPVRPEVDRWSLVGNDLCLQAAVNHALQLKTPGLQERDFIPISDIARGVEHLLSLDPSRTGDGLFNLGGECSMTIRALARLIGERCETVLGFSPALHIPPARDGPREEPLVYSIEKLKATGFRLEGSLEDEIDATLAFCREHFGEGSR